MPKVTKQQLEDTYFVEFLKWCADPKTEKPSDLIFWLDYHFPTHDNFYEWLVKYKKDAFDG